MKSKKDDTQGRGVGEESDSQSRCFYKAARNSEFCFGSNNTYYMGAYNTKEEMSRVREEGWNMTKKLTKEEALCVFKEYRQKVLKELKD